MAVSVEELQIEINAKAKDANTAIDNLADKLGKLSASLGGLKNATGLTTLAQGVERLSTAMQTMSGVETREFTRVAKGIAKLNDASFSNLASVATNVNHMATALNNLGSVTENAMSIGEMAKNIAKLGNKSVQTAITNIPQLAVAMRDLLTTLSTAPNVSRNIIDMTNALANLANQGSRVGSASRSIVRGMNNTTSSMNRARKSTTSLAAAFGKFYATWFLVIRGAKQFINAIEGTADYIEAYNYYNVALGKIASEWNQDWEKYGYANAEAYADSFTDRLNKSLGKLSGLQIDESQQLLTETGLKNLGLNIQEITQYASQLASITNSIGQTGEVSLAAASAFTKLAGDISSLFNIDYSSAAQNLQSGLIGQSRALYKYGIDITNATLQTYAYNLGLEKAVSEMTQAEKMQLRMVAILDQSKVSWGDLANTINSPSNMLRQFSNNVKEAGMVLGQLFIPVLQKVLPVVNGVVIAINRLLVSIAQLLGVKLDLDSFGQGYTDLSDGFDDMSDSLDGVASSAKKAKAGLRAFDELKVINMPETSGGAGGVGGGAIDLTDEILKATSEYEKVWQEAYDRMANKAQEIADRISKTLEPVRKIFEDFAVGDFFQAGEDTSHLVASIFDFFSDAIDRVDWYGIGQKIGDFLAGIDWTAVLSAAGRLIWEGLKAAFELFVGMFDAAPLETAVISLVAMPKLLKTITSSKLIKGVKKLWENFGVWGEKAELLAGTLLGNKAAASGLSMLYPKLSKKVDTIKKAFSNFGKSVSDKGLWKTIDGGISSVRNNLGLFQKGFIGVVSVFGEFALLKDGFYDIASGADNLVESIGKIAAGAGLASAALYTAFGPAGLAIAGITAVVSAISGINKAFDEISAEQIGESIKSALSTPGGTPVEDLAANISNALSTAAESFSKLNNTAEFNSTKENIQGVVSEIDEIKQAMDLGVLSVEEGKTKLTNLFGELVELTGKEMDLLTQSLLGLYGDGGALNQSLDTVGATSQEATDAIIRAKYATTDAAKEIYEQMKNVDFGSSEWNNLYQQLLEVSSGMDNVQQGAFIFSDNINTAANEIDWENLLLPDGSINTEYLKSMLGDISGSLDDYENALEEAEKQTKLYWEELLTKAATPEDKELFEKLRDNVHDQFEKMREDAETQISGFTDMLKVDLFKRTSEEIENAQNQWGEKSPIEKWTSGLFGAGTESELVYKAADTYKKNVLDPAMEQINSALSEMNIDSKWSEDQTEKLFGGLFDITTMGGQINRRLNENYKSIIEDALKDLPGYAEQYGRDFGDGYSEGISESSSKAADAASEMTSAATNKVPETQESGSPSKVTEGYGKDFVEGYNLGISENVESTKKTVSTYMTSVIDKFNSFQSSFMSIGQQIMSGLINGMSSMETSLYKKAEGIADNITKTVQDALEIHSPSKVMFEIGDYTMQGFKLGMENLYQPIASSMKKFGKDIRLAPAPTLDSIYNNMGYGYLDSYKTLTYEPIFNYAGNYGQSNAETNALLRELLDAVKRGQRIEVNGRELGRTVREEANDYFGRTGKPYFAF